MKTVITLAVASAVSLSAISCKSNKTAGKDPYNNGNQYGQGYQDPYASAGEYDNVYAAGGANRYEAASVYQNPAPRSDEYYVPPQGQAYTPPATAGAGSHTVQKGDTLYNLSRRYGTTVSAIRQNNGISGNLIRIGERLLIP
ncbi:MAG: LysM peptidoglycan-binding domain-containing protein [Verrucomicrobiales bacterium]